MRCLQAPTGTAADAAARHRAPLPVLETERLRLRPPTMEDFPLWDEIFAEESGGHLGGPTTQEDRWYDFAAYTACWLLHGTGMFTVERSGAAIGFVILGLEWGDEEPELGWLFPKRNHGQGYASEAATALRDYALQVYGPGKAVSYIHATNTRSQALAARIGAKRDHRDEARLGCQVWRHGAVQ